VDVLRLLKGLEALAAEGGLLEAAEGAGVVVGGRVVDPDGAGAQLLMQRIAFSRFEV
jgi:hypothetical protein